ncbi:MAG TPA: hypothetical protein VGM11_02760 [Acidobacteriaceae bacterium]|jgi:hypothetical protein
MNSNNNSVTPSTLEQRIDRALEHKTEVHIPADFAARVASRAATQPLKSRRRRPQFGWTIALISAPVATVALFALAPHATTVTVTSLSFDVELALVAELAFVGWWIARTLHLPVSR